MPPPPSNSRHPRTLDSQVDAVMDATRVLVAIVAQSLAEVENAVTLPQLRVLVLVHRHGQLNLAGVAAGLGVHASTASRTCDPLVRSGLLVRADDPRDRRHLALTLTPEGQTLVDSVMDHRRRAIKEVVQRMPSGQRDRLATAFSAFTSAAGDWPGTHADALGWAR